MRENQFQPIVKATIEGLLPGCVVIKNDSSYIQGFPDLLVLYNDKWAALEVKRSESEPFQPNQEYYIDKLNGMSFAAVICPENMGDVLHALQLALRPRRGARLPQRE